MASIIKVDTIQKPDGTAPTLEDLSIDKAGTPIGSAYKYQNSLISLTAVDTWVDVTGSSFTYTPKEVGSLILLEASTHCYVNLTGWSNVAIRLLVDGTSVSHSANNSSHYGYANYNDRGMGYAVDLGTYTTTSTSAITVKAQVKKLQGSGTPQINNYGYGFIKLTEIAQ